MANAVQELSSRTPGKESMAMEAFAKALRQLPTIIADNAGYDSSQLLSELRALHSEGKTTMGLGEGVWMHETRRGCVACGVCERMRLDTKSDKTLILVFLDATITVDQKNLDWVPILTRRYLSKSTS